MIRIRPVGAALVGIAVFGLALVGASEPATAIPRFAARVGQNCILCHQDPAGGGLRSLYATQFLVPTELVMFEPANGETLGIVPQIGKNLIVGTDVQTLYLEARRTPTESGFFQMQASFYLDFQLSERWSAQMARRENGDIQSFGMGFVLPWNGYVKVGRFWPAFGLRLEDHTAFVRRGLGSTPPSDSDTGLEVGVYPGPFALNAGVFNGALGATLDNDRSRAVLGRAGVRLRLGRLLLSGGGSIWRNRETVDIAGARGTRLNYGPFGTVSLGPATWLGEFDWSRLSTGAGDRTALFVTQELSWQLRKGLDLRGTYSFENPDWGTGGGDTQDRWGAGVDARVYPYLRVAATVNFGQFSAGTTPLVGAGRKDTEVVLTAHFFY